MLPGIVAAYTGRHMSTATQLRLPVGSSRPGGRGGSPSGTGDGRHLLAAFESAGDEVLRRTLAATGTSYADYRYILVHQVTRSYVEKFCAATGVPADKLIPTVHRYGNMAAATLGVQLAEIYDSLESGDRVLFVGLAGGISLQTLVWQK